MVVGWVCLAGSLLAIFISFGVGPESWELSSTYGAGRAAEKLANQFQLQIIAGALFSLFLVFWSVGYIVKAISFLPGKSQRKRIGRD